MALIEDDGLVLPAWRPVNASNPPPRKPALIHGLLRRGHVALVSGKGKSGKSFIGIELAVAVADYGDWLGFQVERGPVLYVDPELDPLSLDDRFHKVALAMGANLSEVDRRVKRWSLRGVADATMGNLLHDLEIGCSPGDFALVVIDSASVFVTGDENSAVDVRRFATQVNRVSELTGASVLVIHHQGKGHAGDRDPIERSRGSSVWGDAFDAPLSLTEIFPPSGDPADFLGPGERAFVIEDSGLREFPSLEPLHLVFSYPVHRVDRDGITDNWKPKSGQSAGGKTTGEIRKAQAGARHAAIGAKLLAHYYKEGIGLEGIVIKEAAEVAGVDVRTLEDALRDSEHFEVVQVSQRKRRVVPRNPPRAPDPELPLEGN